MKSNRRRPGASHIPAAEAELSDRLPKTESAGQALTADEELKRVKAVPVREVIALGRTRFNPLQPEAKASPFLNALYASPDFADIPYKTWDIKELRQKLKRDFERLRKAGSAEEAAVYLRSVTDMWTEFLTLYEIARLRSMEPGEEQAFYEEEYARAEQTAPLLEKSVLKLGSAILSKPWLDELGQVLGKPFLLRLNSYFTLSELGFRDLRREERELCRRTMEQAELFAHTAQHVKGLRQPDILLDDLLRLRNDLGSKLGFASFRDYALNEQRFYDYDPDKLRRLREAVKRYLLPIHTYLHKKLSKKLAETRNYRLNEETLRQAAQTADLAPRYERLSDSLREYYEKVWSQEDWELRDIPEFAREQTAEEEAGSWSLSKLYWLREAPELFFKQICGLVDACLPRQQRGFLQLLGAKGYIRLDFKEPPSPLKVRLMMTGACPLLTGTYRNNSFWVSDFLGLAGKTYAAILANEAGTAIMPRMALSEECQAFHGLGMEMMALEHMDMLFGEQAPGYAKQRMLFLLRALLKACLIDEFEEAIYKQGELSMSDRLELWRHLRENYALEFHTHEVFWADEAVREAIFEHPFAVLIRELPVVAALTLWDIYRSKRKQAMSYYENICRLGGSDTFLPTLEEALFPDPFTVDNIKRLAYQMASFLEN